MLVGKENEILFILDRYKCGLNQRTLGSKEVDWGVPHQLKEGTSVSDGAGSRRRIDCEIPHRLRKRTKYPL